MNVGAPLAADPAIYDRSRRQLIPCFDDCAGATVTLPPFPRARGFTCLAPGTFVVCCGGT